jgi:hypothetical protein
VWTIEDLTGEKVLSYRTPNFSLKLEAYTRSIC